LSLFLRQKGEVYARRASPNKKLNRWPFIRTRGVEPRSASNMVTKSPTTREAVYPTPCPIVFTHLKLARFALLLDQPTQIERNIDGALDTPKCSTSLMLPMNISPKIFVS
jgi:hypothetical protein